VHGGMPNGKDKPQTEHEKNLSKMENKDYTVSITVNATADEAFRAVTSVKKWWTENLEGSSQNLNDEFTVRFGDVHMSKQKLIEVIPDRKVIWLVSDSRLNFVKDKSEWTNTRIRFDIAEKDGKTQIKFTHEGLIPEIECYDGCSNAWGHYIKGSLFKLLTEGKGAPELREAKSQ
jgi:hypothetical protein